ncbi:GntR family transcriptional regulator [Streptomyces syringium]|uniref:GntR family transcriptional regulator n=1 Tax=Streptomyces syringium TaxID=76729 RepID=UPI00343F94B5
MAAREIDHRAPEPPFRQIAADLTGEIERGELSPGRPVPSEKELVERYGVARNTVRSALAVLRENGLVYTVPNRGTYVCDRNESAGDGQSKE